MARKINKIEAHASIPTSQIKKSIAELLVRRLLAVWVIENVTLKMLPLSSIPVEARSVRVELPRRAYIPAVMPPSEIRNGPDTGGWCKFVEPQSATWREQHRAVNLAIC